MGNNSIIVCGFSGKCISMYTSKCFKCDHNVNKHVAKDYFSNSNNGQTNGDRIRNMTDDELIEFIGNIKVNGKAHIVIDGKELIFNSDIEKYIKSGSK